MRVTATTKNVLSSRSSDDKIEVNPASLIQTFDLNDYITNYVNSPSFLDSPGDGGEQGGVSNLQLNPEVKDMLKEKFWRTWYHLKHVQAGPFAVYNNPTPIDVNGLFPATSHPVVAAPEKAAEAATIVANVAPTEVVNGTPVQVVPVTQGQVAPNTQFQVVPAAGQVAVTVAPQAVTAQASDQPSGDEISRSMDTKAVPTNLGVTTAPGGDPNTPPLANVPLVNVIGGKNISAPGVIPSEIMDKHPLFSTNSLAPNDYYKVNVENVTKSVIAVAVVLFLVGVVVYRIRTRKKPKKKK